MTLYGNLFLKCIFQNPFRILGVTADVSKKEINSTSYTLTLMYSGNESKRLVLSPNSTGSVRLKNGSCRIAASVSSSNVSNYVGTEFLNGGSYIYIYDNGSLI